MDTLSFFSSNSSLSSDDSPSSSPAFSVFHALSWCRRLTTVLSRWRRCASISRCFIRFNSARCWGVIAPRFRLVGGALTVGEGVEEGEWEEVAEAEEEKTAGLESCMSGKGDAAVGWAGKWQGVGERGGGVCGGGGG